MMELIPLNANDLIGTLEKYGTHEFCDEPKTYGGKWTALLFKSVADDVNAASHSPVRIVIDEAEDEMPFDHHGNPVVAHLEYDTNGSPVIILPVSAWVESKYQLGYAPRTLIALRAAAIQNAKTQIMCFDTDREKANRLMVDALELVAMATEAKIIEGQEVPEQLSDGVIIVYTAGSEEETLAACSYIIDQGKMPIVLSDRAILRCMSEMRFFDELHQNVAASMISTKH